MRVKYNEFQNQHPNMPEDELLFLTLKTSYPFNKVSDESIRKGILRPIMGPWMLEFHAFCPAEKAVREEKIGELNGNEMYKPIETIDGLCDFMVKYEKVRAANEIHNS